MDEDPPKRREAKEHPAKETDQRRHRRRRDEHRRDDRRDDKGKADDDGGRSRTPRTGGHHARRPRPRKVGLIPTMEVSINGGTPIAGWFTMENPNIKRMMIGGTLG